MLFTKFASENAFRTDFVVPLLTRLGLLGVTDLHGNQEYGKDVVCSEITRLGTIRHVAAVIKHAENVSQGNNALIGEIESQVRQAFDIPFLAPDDPNYRRISSVYVLNSGNITEGAKTVLLSRFQAYGANVAFLDGQRLLDSDRYGTLAQDDSLRTKLLGLRTQFNMNLEVWHALHNGLPDVKEGRGALLFAIESFLSHPFGQPHIDIDTVAKIWQRAKILETLRTLHILNPPANPDVKKADTEMIRQLCVDLLDDVNKVYAQIAVAIEELDRSRYAG